MQNIKNSHSDATMLCKNDIVLFAAGTLRGMKMKEISKSREEEFT